MISYKGNKTSKVKKFRSILECGFAMLLDQDPLVKAWEYEYIRYAYFDGFTGKQKTYVCDFYVEKSDIIEQIEIKPLNKQLPLDKYLYAKNCMPGWRWVAEEEINKSYEIFKSGYNSKNVIFINKLPKTKYYSWYSKKFDEKFAEPWSIKTKSNFGKYCIYKLINANYKHHRRNKLINSDLDKILLSIKEGKKQKEIAKEFSVDPRTIREFLEKNSYTIRWRPVTEIRYATKLIWSDKIKDDEY